MNSVIDTRICKLTDIIKDLTDILYNHFNSFSEIHLDKILGNDIKRYILQGKTKLVKKIFEREISTISRDDIKELLINQLSPHLKRLKENLYAVLESPYIDKMYRDAYYTYYSSKLKEYNRDTCRISFFNAPIDYDNFRDFGSEEENPIANNYLGYMVIRPTLDRIVGRTLLSPKALKNDQFVCCQTKITSTANSIKFSVRGFPYASQDGQTITCAETTIVSLMEYFGTKFPDYKPILPSSIHQILARILTKRQIPSEGLYLPQMSYVMRELGFGSMVYSKSKYGLVNFYSIISTYVESGIPIIGIYLDHSRHIGHAVNIIGHEKDNIKALVRSKNVTKLSNGGRVVDYHSINKQFVVIDDNYPPYQIADLRKKNILYGSNATGYELTDIIVPLYNKIYLEAFIAKEKVLQILQFEKIGLKNRETVVTKTFLASTRSYKQYLAMNKTIEPLLKELLLMIPMPRFIWVTELSDPKSFEKGCIGLIILDATEPLKQNNENERKGESLMHTSLIAVYNKGLLYWQNLLNFEKERIFAPNFVSIFSAYNENLKPAYRE